MRPVASTAIGTSAAVAFAPDASVAENLLYGREPYLDIVIKIIRNRTEIHFRI